MDYDLIAIGERIKDEREKLGLSQKKLAEKCYVSARQTVAKWEQGLSLPSLDDCVKLCSLFDCELGYLLCEYNEKTRVTTDICAETGLSNVASDKLQNIKSGKVSGLDHFSIRVISDMIEDELFLEEIGRLRKDIGSIPEKSEACMLHYVSPSEHKDMGFRPIGANRLRTLLLSGLQNTVYDFLYEHYFSSKED